MMEQSAPAGLGAALAEQSPPQQGMPQQGSGPQQASPEEQALLEHTVAKAYELIYNERSIGAYLQTLQGNGNPARGLATATTQTLARVAQAAEKAGQKLPGDVLFAAGKEIVEDLADLSADANIKDYSQDQDILDGAYFQAVDDFRQMLQQNGRVNQQAQQQDLDQLRQMGKSGEMESILMGMAEAEQGAAQ